MTRRKTTTIEQLPEEATVQEMEPAVVMDEPDELLRIAHEWVITLVETPVDAAVRIVDALHAAGIHTQDQLAKANVNLVRRVLMAALQADAHSLTGLAARFQMED